MARREANRAKNERQCARKQKERLKGIARAAAKARGGGGREVGGGRPLLSQSPHETMKRTRTWRRGR
jgi:hypothetical protein